MPASMTETEDGVVLIANGIDPVMRWNGYDPAASRAGVAAPTTAPTVSLVDTPPRPNIPGRAPSGSGPITGTYLAFVRFVDRFGNRSDPSPFSNTVVADGAGGFVYDGVPVPADGAVVRRQVLRNTDGQQSTFYVDIDTTDLGSTSLFSARLDADLAAQEAQPLFADDGTAVFNRYGRPPSTVKLLAFHLGRAFGGGVEDYAEGSVAVANGSTAVLGSGVEWSAEFRGRFLHVLGGDKPYEIAACDPVAGTLTLAEAYRGPTDAYAAYSVRPDPTLPNTVFYSEAGRPESWPAVNAFTVDQDGDRVTALIPFDSFLFVAKRRRMYRLSAESDPARDGYVFNSIDRGCVNHRCWAQVNNTLYCLDEQGAYRFGGGRDADAISTPIQDLFRNTSRDGLRINWRCARYFHAVVSPSEEVVRWFVTINGGYLPRWALCFSYSLSRWWLEEYPYPIGASCRGRTGRPTSSWGAAAEQVYLGGRSAKCWGLGGSPTDGPVSWQPSHGGLVSTAGPLSVTAAATFPASVVGSPVTVCSGRGAGQTRIVVASPGDGVLVVDRPWVVTPAAGDGYAIGGVPYRFRSHRLELAASEDREELSVRVGYEPQRWGTAAVRRYNDHDAKPEALAADLSPADGDGLSGRKGEREMRLDMTYPHGYFLVRADRHREGNTPGLRSVRVEIEGVSGPTRHRFNGLRVKGAVT